MSSAEAHLARVRFARELSEAFPSMRVELVDDGVLVQAPERNPIIVRHGDSLHLRKLDDAGEAVASLTFTLEAVAAGEN